MKKCICSNCGEKISSSTDKCPRCNGNILLNNKYQLLDILGQSQIITYLAQDKISQKKVVIKELSIHKILNWKQEELFLREMQVLQQLDHPQIPKYIDYFRLESGKYFTHYLIHEYIEGITLEKELAKVRYTETDVLNTMLNILTVLAYLHAFQPPIIHRDIKPSNLIRKKDNSIVIIDFGTVRDLIKGTIHGDTIAGTFGYMAPEQFMGKALVQSDIYAVGVVAVTMFSHLSPNEMIAQNHKLNWRPYVNATPFTIRLLEHFLEPDPLNRPQNVSEALLLTKETLFQYGNLILKKSSKAEKDDFLDSIEGLESSFKKSFLPFNFSRLRGRQDQVPSMQTWSRIIADKNLLPQPFKEHFIEHEKEFPYTVYIPQQIVMGINLQNPKLLCLYQKKFVTYENRKKNQVKQELYELVNIGYLEHVIILLRSWIQIHHFSDIKKIYYNSVNDHLFNPILCSLRRKTNTKLSLSITHDSHQQELLKLNYLKHHNLKYLNYSRSTILPGDIIISSVFQPGFAYKRFLFPRFFKSHLSIMTNKELILIKEPANDRHTKDINHGCFITYIPFQSIENLFFKDYKMMIVLRIKKIISINFSPGNPDFEIFKVECEEFTKKNKVF